MGTSLQKQKDLEEAIGKGDMAEVVNLIHSGVSVNASVRGKWPLYFAIQQDQTEIAELLLTYGANAEDGYFSDSPLHLVAVKGNAHIASKLLRRDVDVNATSCRGCTPLWLAASKGHFSVVQLLLRYPFIDVDCPQEDAYLKSTKTSALCQAVFVQHLDMCKLLLANGASVDLGDINGCTPLHHACRLGNAAITIELIKHGCALNCVDKHGYTPLHTAVSHDHCCVVDALIQAGCDINLPCLSDWNISPLHTAAKRGNANIVSALCSASGISLDSKDCYSMTPIILACKEGNTQCLQHLLNSGTDVASLTGVGLCPLSISVCLEEDPLIQWRLQQREAVKRGDGSSSSAVEDSSRGGCDMEYASPEHSSGIIFSQVKWSSLSLEDIVWSVVRTLGTGQQTDHVDVLHVLLKAGADIRMMDDFHNAAMEYALNLYGVQSVLLLLCHGAAVSENLLNSFLASSYLKPHPIIHGFAFPMTVALIWTSAPYRRLLRSYYDKFPFHKYYQLPQPIKTALFSPMTLAQSCRGVVRDMLTQNTSCSIVPLVEQLPVPRAVKQFLLLSDTLLMLVCYKWRGSANETVTQVNPTQRGYHCCH